MINVSTVEADVLATLGKESHTVRDIEMMGNICAFTIVNKTPEVFDALRMTDSDMEKWNTSEDAEPINVYTTMYCEAAEKGGVVSFDIVEMDVLAAFVGSNAIDTLLLMSVGGITEPADEDEIYELDGTELGNRGIPQDEYDIPKELHRNLKKVPGFFVGMGNNGNISGGAGILRKNVMSPKLNKTYTGGTLKQALSSARKGNLFIDATIYAADLVEEAGVEALEIIREFLEN